MYIHGIERCHSHIDSMTLMDRVVPNPDLQAPVDSSGGTLPSRDRLITQCGCLRLSFHYELPSKRRNAGRMSLLVCDAVDLPNEDRGGATHVQFHLVLLPAKKSRHKTRVRPGGNTTFDETFEFRLTPGIL